jgi:hypothetical protein
MAVHQARTSEESAIVSARPSWPVRLSSTMAGAVYVGLPQLRDYGSWPVPLPAPRPSGGHGGRDCAMVGHVHGLRELDRLILQGLEHADPAILVAVDGRSGVGKSTLAIQLADRYGGGSILADDFYPGGSDLH